jgi:propanol-preferring alcohol dehydrogenase
MLAYRLFAPAPVEERPLRLIETATPDPGPGQVRIRISACGVCHTDLHIAEGEVKPPSVPVTPGHQVVGLVDAVGPDVRDLTIGQRVGVPWLYSACGKCSFCRSGQENLCPNARFTGLDVNGGYAEQMIAEASFVLPLPEQLTDMEAAPLLCAGIIGYRAYRLAAVAPGERVGLFGFGASAHLVLPVAKSERCEVYVFTRSSNHQLHARQLGADWVGGPQDSPPDLLDHAILFAPNGNLVPIALQRVRPAGSVVINAIYSTPVPPMPYELLYGERVLRTVSNATRQDGRDFLELAARIGLKPTVNLYPMDKANEALEDLKHSRFNGEAVLDFATRKE